MDIGDFLKLNWKDNYWVKPDYLEQASKKYFSDIEFRDDGEYLITSTLYDKDTMVTFWRKKDLPQFWGTEVYIGSNYVVGSDKSSRSYNYNAWIELPNKYKKIAERLREANRLRWV